MQDIPKQTVLIVDDNEITVEVLMEALGDEYRVEVAANGDQGLEMAEAMQPDIILLDILMPGISGYDVCRKLKGNPLTKAIPVIFVSVKGEVADEIMGFELGAVDYISKPISPPIVRARVATHLALNAAMKTLGRQNQALREAARLREDVNRITSHDLKGPLQVIMLQTDLMFMLHGENDPKRQTVMAIRNAALRMLNIINYSLDVFKMEQGNYEYEPSELDILDVAERAWSENLSLAQAKGLQIRLLMDGRALQDEQKMIVRGEDLLCYSIFTHLIRNAIEASPENKAITIDVCADDNALINIHNHGEVPEEIGASLFEKYVTHGKKHGTGLGAYAAKLMAEVQGGAISYQSSAEAGTTITVQLPR